MKIQNIITYPVAVPFKTPFTDALGTVSALPHVIVEITTDERVSGWGEINTNHPSWEENLGGAIYAVNRIFKPALIGKDPMQPEVIQSIMDSLTPLNTLTKAGIDIAIYDILGKVLNVPIYKLLGGCFRKDVLGLWDVSLGSPADMAKEAQTVADKYGFRVRACLGTGWKTDLKRYSAVRQALGPEELIATEANMGWTPNEAIQAISAYQDDNVSFIEQPVSRFDLEGLRRIARRVRIPVVADESLHTPEDAWRLAKTQAVTCFNVKIMKHGLTKAKQIVSLARAANIDFYLGTGSELGIAAAACAHFAASLVEASIDYYAAGFASSSSTLTDDILVEPTTVRKGRLRVPEGPGLGVDVDRQRLEKYKTT